MLRRGPSPAPGAVRPLPARHGRARRRPAWALVAAVIVVLPAAVLVGSTARGLTVRRRRLCAPVDRRAGVDLAVRLREERTVRGHDQQCHRGHARVPHWRRPFLGRRDAVVGNAAAARRVRLDDAGPPGRWRGESGTAPAVRLRQHPEVGQYDRTGRPLSRRHVRASVRPRGLEI
jgi:hypothetical protein